MNVSVQGEKAESQRVEIKNVAGAKNVERAVEHEYRRHVALLEQGLFPEPETRRFDADTATTTTLRRKEEEPDYRFFQDPDLPQFAISNERISSMHGNLGEVPFEVKRRFCNQFGMDVSDVKNIFRNPWSIELFTRLIWSLQIDPKTVYNWVYEHIYGNCEKKDLDFQNVIEQKFGHKKLCELLLLLHQDDVTIANGKQIMMRIIDGDERMPQEIADDLGLTRGTDMNQEVHDAVTLVIESNPEIVKKIKEGNDRPIMSLVGQVMKAVNRRGDPVVIKSMLAKDIGAPDKAKSAASSEDKQ